ncbi:MAG: methylamine utilization protein, partial [Thermoanaerobaculia bacterium]
MLIRFLAYAFALWAALPSGTGGVSGKVTVVKAGEPLPDASNTVVWIEGLTLPAAHPGVVKAEMKSQRKSFQPRVIALPREGAVDFPNVDPIFHNVFSVSAGNRFDLVLYRSGTSKPIVFHESGLVRVYCNIHPTM